MTNVVKLPVNGYAFDEFWEQCPRKAGRALTRKKWEEIISEKGLQTHTLCRDSGKYVSIHLQATPQELIEGMKRYRKSQYDPNTYKLKDNGQYTLHPATWLNQGRWEDG
jgi:hypothetical protein